MKQAIKKIIPAPCIKIARSFLSQAGRLSQKVPSNAKFFSHGKNQVFFGYYDVSPFSPDDRYLLACQTHSENVTPHNSHPDLELGYYDLEEKEAVFKPFGKTACWNWQQGSRLQWFPDHKKYSGCVIYNTKEGGGYCAVIQNIFSGKIEQKLDVPVYSVSPDGAFALSLDFDRLHDCRPGYGYNHFPNKARKDEIIYVDIQSAQTRTILTMDTVLGFLPHASMNSAEHYFNHLSISPSGKRYMVTHLWVSSSGKRFSRLLIGDPMNSDSLICPNNSGHTSHYCWQGDDKVMIFGTHENQKSHYHLYDLAHNTSSVIGENVLREDGHPTWIDEERLITDTYPNLIRHQRVLHYDVKQDKLLTLGSFHTPENFTGEVRCDLHPRINQHKNKVSVDCVRDGRRAICVVDIPETR